MKWVKLAIDINEEAAELVSEILLEAGASGTQTEGGKMPDVSGLDEIPLDMPDSTDCRVCAYFPMDGESDAKIECVQKSLAKLKGTDIGFDPGLLTTHTETVDEQDWENEWKKYFKPTRVSDFVVVKPTWEEYTPLPDDIVVEIDPGMAFGTGAHETTRMCIAMLEEYLEQGNAVLDIGCGSGILAIAAAKLGAGAVLALDVDNVAVETARKNVAINHKENIVLVKRANILDETPTDARFHIVVANIIADVIIQLNDTVSKYLTRPGIYIVSGIIADRLDEVLESLNSHGLRSIKVAKMGEWRAIVCMNKG
ncbi:MAG: 50S ribosomal protein L11 methyltransferase [Eubacteriales bacterium]